MKYIGPFFRMNSLSKKEIESQLFFLCKESLKHITLESRCGIVASAKTYKKYLSPEDMNTLKDFSPLLSLYKKGKPKLSSNKHFNSWSELSLKKEINCFSNSMMTYCIISLMDYYKKFKALKTYNFTLYNIYKTMSKLQLDFYSTYLRNGDGVFVDKKNLSTSSSEISLSDSSKKFKLSDQAFMMNSYYYYWLSFKDDKDSITYKEFSLEILNMFLNFKEELYNLSFEECLKLCLAFNSFYKLCPSDALSYLIIDLTDYLLDKSDEKNYIFDGLDNSCLLAINLYLSYKNTKMENFKDSFINLSERHKKLFNIENSLFLKPNDKKEIKYTSLELLTFMMNMLLLNDFKDSETIEDKSLLSSLYKNSIINSNILLSWPEAPSLDSNERYVDLTLDAEDLLEETMFRMSSTQTPSTIGLAPVFIKSVSFSKKKNMFLPSKASFDSTKHVFICFLITHLFKDKVMNYWFNNKRESNNPDKTSECD